MATNQACDPMFRDTLSGSAILQAYVPYDQITRSLLGPLKTPDQTRADQA